MVLPKQSNAAMQLLEKFHQFECELFEFADNFDWPVMDDSALCDLSTPITDYLDKCIISGIYNQLNEC